MITERMATSLNEQINRELFSAYQYLAMAAYAQSKGLAGVAHWFEKQAEEERGHAMKIYGYLFDQNQKVTLLAIQQPQPDFESIAAAFAETLEHEKRVTSSISNLATIASEERDYATSTFLQWFITEQVEEEASVRAIIDRLNLVKDSGQGLLILDRELANR